MTTHEPFTGYSFSDFLAWALAHEAISAIVVVLIVLGVVMQILGRVLDSLKREETKDE